MAPARKYDPYARYNSQLGDRAQRLLGLAGDTKSDIPYFTKFGQRPIPKVVKQAAKMLFEVSGVKDVAMLSNAIIGAGPAPAYPLLTPGAVKLGGRWEPKTPGLKAEALQRGDPMLNFTGDRVGHRDFDLNTHGYNLRDTKNNEIVGSASTIRTFNGNFDENKVYVDSIFVRPEYRKTRTFFDLINLVTHGGKLEPHGSIVNPRLAEVAKRRFNRKAKELGVTIEKSPRPSARHLTEWTREEMSDLEDAFFGYIDRPLLRDDRRVLNPGPYRPPSYPSRPRGDR